MMILYGAKFFMMIVLIILDTIFYFIYLGDEFQLTSKDNPMNTDSFQTYKVVADHVCETYALPNVTTIKVFVRNEGQYDIPGYHCGFYMDRHSDISFIKGCTKFYLTPRQCIMDTLNAYGCTSIRIID